jgi:hypothetical protein
MLAQWGREQAVQGAEDGAIEPGHLGARLVVAQHGEFVT